MRRRSRPGTITPAGEGPGDCSKANSSPTEIQRLLFEHDGSCPHRVISENGSMVRTRHGTLSTANVIQAASRGAPSSQLGLRLLVSTTCSFLILALGSCRDRQEVKDSAGEFELLIKERSWSITSPGITEVVDRFQSHANIQKWAVQSFGALSVADRRDVLNILLILSPNSVYREFDVHIKESLLTDGLRTEALLLLRYYPLADRRTLLLRCLEHCRMLDSMECRDRFVYALSIYLQYYEYADVALLVEAAMQNSMRDDLAIKVGACLAAQRDEAARKNGVDLLEGITESQETLNDDALGQLFRELRRRKVTPTDKILAVAVKVGNSSRELAAGAANKYLAWWDSQQAVNQQP